MRDRSIGYLCSAHQRDGVGALTIIKGEWAFCPAGAADGHAWDRVAPTSLVDLDIARLSAHPTVRSD